MPEFGTSGLRGLAVELTDELCATYAAAFVAKHGKGGRLLIGQDRRESSPRITRAVAAGAVSEGAEVVDCGVLPTPALALAAAKEGAVAIMVTGSHIPADRNGLKFYTRAGEFTKADEAPLRDAVAARVAPGVASVEVEENRTARSDYVARYLDGFPAGALKGRRIGVWLHSSAASTVLPEILEGLGAAVVGLGQSDAFISVDTEAVDAETRGILAAWVREHALDALVSTDGDADRPLLVDDRGEVIPGDILGPITARWAGADEVVTTVSANTMVDLMGGFRSVTRTRIGSPYIIAEMEARQGARVAGYEPNGGFLLGWDMERGFRPLMTRDSTLPLLAVLVSAAGRGVAVSALLDDLPQRRTATDRLKDIPREKSLALVEAILGGDHSVLPDGLGRLSHVDQTDGARMAFSSGRIVTVRPSGNAPELRCYVEAESQAAADALLADALSRLRAALL
ncbi:phosphomannomutase [Silicimonas sp. MF1-12-2]|uniref:phosphomannomutase n=1 Tax=Silicimonas sp. MF1-12-2 TaxID=3384793 RepID=UPI0039B65196